MAVRDALVDDGAGRLSIGGSRYLLVRPETLVALHRAVERALGERAAECLAEGGRAGGAHAAKSLEGSREARVERLLRMGGEIGWGHFTLERLAPTELVVSVRQSPFAEAHGPSSRPVCHLTRGVLESLAAAVLDRPVRVMETACVATGASACRFATVGAGGRAGRGRRK